MVPSGMPLQACAREGGAVSGVLSVRRAPVGGDPCQACVRQGCAVSGAGARLSVVRLGGRRLTCGSGIQPPRAGKVVAPVTVIQVIHLHRLAA